MKKLNAVLLIDDDEITNFINEDLVKAMGITNEVLIAKNGKEGIDMVKTQCQTEANCPALILLDINMPVMNGFEFLEQYQQLELTGRPSMILVMLTSSENEKDIERIKHSTAVDYLSKPLNKEKLRQVMEKHFGNQGD